MQIKLGVSTHFIGQYRIYIIGHNRWDGGQGYSLVLTAIMVKTKVTTRRLRIFFTSTKHVPVYRRLSTGNQQTVLTRDYIPNDIDTKTQSFARVAQTNEVAIFLYDVTRSAAATRPTREFAFRPRCRDVTVCVTSSGLPPTKTPCAFFVLCLYGNSGWSSNEFDHK